MCSVSPWWQNIVFTQLNHTQERMIVRLNSKHSNQCRPYAERLFFVPVLQNKTLPIEDTTDCLSTMACVCRVMLETP